MELCERPFWGDELELNEEMEKVIAKQPFSEIQDLQGKLSDRAARRWYLEQDERIPLMIDADLSIEEQAMLAFELRNQNRTWARDLIFNQILRRKLDISDPNVSFEYKILDKMQRKNLTREEAIIDILKTATKTRDSVNKSLGLK